MPDTPDTYICPDCRTALRVRPGAVLRDVACPECGLPLHLDRDVDGVLTVTARRPVPTGGAESGGWPLRVGVGVAIAGAVLLSGSYLWIRAQPGNQFPERIAPADPGPGFAPIPPPPDPEPELLGPDPPPVLAEEPAIAPPAFAEDRARPQADMSPSAPAAAAERVAAAPPREPIEANRPAIDRAAVRFARRLAQPIGRYRVTKPVPLGEVTADLESLLGVRITLPAAAADRPVRVEAEAVSAGELLDRVAAAAGLRAVVGDGRVRLEVAASDGAAPRVR